MTTLSTRLVAEYTNKEGVRFSARRCWHFPADVRWLELECVYANADTSVPAPVRDYESIRLTEEDIDDLIDLLKLVKVSR